VDCVSTAISNVSIMEWHGLTFEHDVGHPFAF